MLSGSRDRKITVCAVIGPIKQLVHRKLKWRFNAFESHTFCLSVCLSCSGSSGGKHSHSVSDQQSRTWQDSSTVDHEIRHIDAGSLPPVLHPPFPSHPTPPSKPLQISRRNTRILKRQHNDVQQIFIAFTIRTCVYMSPWICLVFFHPTQTGETDKIPPS